MRRRRNCERTLATPDVDELQALLDSPYVGVPAMTFTTADRYARIAAAPCVLESTVNRQQPPLDMFYT